MERKRWQALFQSGYSLQASCEAQLYSNIVWCPSALYLPPGSLCLFRQWWVLPKSYCCHILPSLAANFVYIHAAQSPKVSGTLWNSISDVSSWFKAIKIPIATTLQWRSLCLLDREKSWSSTVSLPAHLSLSTRYRAILLLYLGSVLVSLICNCSTGGLYVARAVCWSQDPVNCTVNNASTQNADDLLEGEPNHVF